MVTVIETKISKVIIPPLYLIIHLHNIVPYIRKTDAKINFFYMNHLSISLETILGY